MQVEKGRDGRGGGVEIEKSNVLMMWVGPDELNSMD